MRREKSTIQVARVAMTSYGGPRGTDGTVSRAPGGAIQAAPQTMRTFPMRKIFEFIGVENKAHERVLLF